MVQLTLTHTDGGAITLAGRLATLEQRAGRLSGGAAHAVAAARITRNALASRVADPLSPSDARRVEAYFTAVLRRRILSARDPVAIRARQRLVAASIEADLLQAGWTRLRARAEANRILGEPRPTEGVA